MSKGGRSRVLALVVSVAAGSAFVWATIKALQADPDNLLLMLWALSFVASIGTSGMAIFMYTCSGGGAHADVEPDALVSTVDEGLVYYPVD